MFLSVVKFALTVVIFHTMSGFQICIISIYVVFYAAASPFSFYKVFSSDSSLLQCVCSRVCRWIIHASSPGGAAGGVQKEGGGVCFICSLLPACLSELLLTGSPTAAPPRWQRLLSCSLTQRGDDETHTKREKLSQGPAFLLDAVKMID